MARRTTKHTTAEEKVREVAPLKVWVPEDAVVDGLAEPRPPLVVEPLGGVMPPVVVVLEGAPPVVEGEGEEVVPWEEVVVWVELVTGRDPQGEAVKVQVEHLLAEHQVGRGVQKWLHWMVTLKSGGEERKAGTLPLKELWDRSREMRPGREPNELGMLPTRLL